MRHAGVEICRPRSAGIARAWRRPTTIRGRIPSLDLRTAFAEASHSTFSSLIDVLLELDRRDPAAGYGREAPPDGGARTIAEPDSGAERPARRRRLRRSSERERDRVEQLRSTVGELQTTLLGSGTPSNRNYLLARLDDAERALAALEEDRVRQSRAEGSVNDAWRPFSSDITSLQQTLRDDEVLVEFAQAGSGRVAFVVARDSLKILRLPELDGLRERVDAFNHLLKIGAADEAVVAGRSLARVFLDPVLDQLPRRTRVLLLGVTGPPAAIPFAALPILDAGGRPQPLIARYELAFVPSLSALADLRRRPRVEGQHDLLALADPAFGERDDARPIAGIRRLRVAALPYSRTEVQAVARYVTSPDVLVGTAASESAFKARQGGFRVLHFATHALVDPETPSRSALAAGRIRCG